MGNIPVIAAPPLGDVFVGVGQIPLAAIDAAVITRGRGREHAIHEENSPAHVVDADVAADADLLQLEFVGTKSFRRSAQ